MAEICPTMKDLLLDDNGDIQFDDNGELITGDATNQNQQLILIANKGEWKEFPELGVGIVEMLSNENYNEIMIEAKKNLEYDGMEVNNIRFTENGKLMVDAKYKNNGKKS